MKWGNTEILNQNNLEICKLIVSIISILATSLFSVVTIIITCHNARKQVNESEKAVKLQENQYEKEKLYNNEILRLKEKPYLVIDKASRCMYHGNNKYCMVIDFKNKGNGSAFKIVTETAVKA